MASSEQSNVALKQAAVFVDGTLTRPQLDHPEGLAIAPDGSIYCGGEMGQVYRVAADGSGFEQVADLGGFCLGMAFLDDDLLVCTLGSFVVQRLNLSTGAVTTFADGGDRRFVNPNMLAVSSDGTVYVTDSGTAETPTGLIHRYDRDGNGGVWFEGPLHFANGICFDEAGRLLYVAESFRAGITTIAINDDGSPGEVRDLVRLDGMVPDGVAIGPDDRLYVGCYEPSRVLRVDRRSGDWQILAEDVTAHTLAHPTNVAVRGDDLFTTNLGRWHLTVIEDAFS